MVNRVHLEHTIWPYKHRFLTRLVGIIHDPRGAGVPLKIIGGVVRPRSQTEILTLFQTKKMSFFAPVFRSGL